MNKKNELYSSIFFLVLSVVYFIGALNIKVYSAFGDSGITSSSIPKVLGGLLFILSILNLITVYLRSKDSNKDSIKGDKDLSIFDQSIKAEEELEEGMVENKKATILTFILLIIFAMFLEPLGFILTSIIFLMCQIMLLTPKNVRRRKIPITAVIVVIFTVVVYTLFTKGFSLLLPAGIVG